MKFDAGSSAKMSSRQSMPHFMHKNRNEDDASPDGHPHPIFRPPRAETATQQHGRKPKPPVDEYGNPQQPKFQHAALLNEEARFGEMKSPGRKSVLRPFRIPYCLTALMVVLLPGLPAEPAPQTTGRLAQYSVHWIPDRSHTNNMVVEVSGFSAAALPQLKRPTWEPAEWQRLLSTYVEQDELATGSSVPPMLGVYRFEENVLRFTPQF